MVTNTDMLKSAIELYKHTGDSRHVDSLITHLAQNRDATMLESLASVLFDMWSENLWDKEVHYAYEKCMEKLRVANLREALE